MKNKTHLKSILLALLVTFLWATSFVIIKIGLAEIPALTFAGLRYTIAFICLLPFAFIKKHAQEIKTLQKKDWVKLVLLGILFYSFTQGAQFVGLSLLPAVTVSLWLNFTPLVVAIMAIFMINEYPTFFQWGGVVMFITGVIIYFFPVDLSENQLLGLIVMTFGVFVNSASAVLGRNINRGSKISPIVVTIISMGIGAMILLISGIVIQGLPPISTQNIIYLLWLAIVNTALAFTIWNFTLRTLSAMESSIINGTMLIQIALLAWVFLGEQITPKEILGMLIAAIGTVVVQLKIKRKSL